MTKKVFLDANVIIRAGRPPGGPLMQRVADLVKADLVSIITTNLTMTEVAKKHAENDFDVIKDVGRQHFRRLVQETTGVELPEVSKEKLREILHHKYGKLTEDMFSKLRAKVLSIDDVKPTSVFDAYSTSQGFFSGQSKRDQFPDAFIFECLKPEATEETPLLLVSDDGDFVAPSKSEQHVTVLKSIPDLFTQLGFEIEAPAIFEYIDANMEKIRELLADELGNWELIPSDVEDAYVEQDWVELETLHSFSVFGQIGEERSILVVAKADMKVGVSYTHPDWATATYDSEDKVLIPVMEDISGETDVRVDVEFSMTIAVDEEGKPAEIESVTFRNDRFMYIDLNEDGYLYK
jgi:hypothetical protein